MEWSLGIGSALAACLLLVKSRNNKRILDRFTHPDVDFKVFLGQKSEGTRTVLITGGNGFLGKYIANYLADKQINVIVFDLTISGESSRRKDVTYIRGNLLDTEHLSKAFTIGRSVDSVIHTASLIPYLGVPDEAIWTVNVDGTQNLLNACNQFGVKYLIYTSSATAAIDRSSRVVQNMDETAPPPKQFVDTYAATKSAAERIVLEANKPGGLVTCCLRPGGIFGNGDKLLADKLLQGLDLFCIGDGSARIDFVPVESVALAHVLAEEALFSDPLRRGRMQGASYFIGNNEQRQYGWFLGVSMDGESEGGALSHWGQRRPTHLPVWIVMALAYVNVAVHLLLGVAVLPPFLAPALVDWTQRTYTFCSGRAGRDFGYAPRETVAEAIRRLAAEHRRGL